MLITVYRMIDIHTHILPHIDDGAEDAKEAKKMIDCMQMLQVRIAVCTPHFDPARNSMEKFVAKREKAFSYINNSAVVLLPGSETLYHDLLYQYSELDQICINNTRYLLLELPYSKHWSDRDLECIEKLMNVFRIIPVIAHMERYCFLWKNKKNIRKLINLGCVMQINAKAIIDSKLRKTALHYIEEGLTDVMGSDCHDMSQRYPNLKEAFDIIEREIGIYYCDLLQQNAASIINGKKIRNDGLC